MTDSIKWSPWRITNLGYYVLCSTCFDGLGINEEVTIGKLMPSNCDLCGCLTAEPKTPRRSDVENGVKNY